MNPLRDWYIKADGTIYDILSQIVETAGAAQVLAAVAEIEEKRLRMEHARNPQLPLFGETNDS